MRLHKVFLKRFLEAVLEVFHGDHDLLGAGLSAKVHPARLSKKGFRNIGPIHLREDEQNISFVVHPVAPRVHGFHENLNVRLVQ